MQFTTVSEVIARNVTLLRKRALLTGRIVDAPHPPAPIVEVESAAYHEVHDDDEDERHNQGHHGVHDVGVV